MSSTKAFVAVLDVNGKPIMPTSGKRARKFLVSGRAHVVRVRPFVIQMHDTYQEDCILTDMVVKVDPGSKHTGIAVAIQSEPGVLKVTNLIELHHRGKQISMQLTKRAMLRRARRSRNTRYRAARFLNRAKPKGWIAPSLMHRVITTVNWCKRLMKWYPITELAVERVKFDMQKMQDASIRGQEYQRGELFEREVMEYLLAKYDHTCVYCDTKEARFEKDHVIARSQNGSNRISNLVLSCRPCNQAKDSLPVQTFLAKDPARLARILKQLKTPLRDAAAVNATRNRLLLEMIKLGLPVSTGTGAQTKWNRGKFNIPKTHALDAVCVGVVNDVSDWQRPHLEVKCSGRGRYARTASDKYGFPRLYASRQKLHAGFQTGDLVRAYRPSEKKSYVGIATVRTDLGFTIDLGLSKYPIKATSRNCKCLQKADGYRYFLASYRYFSITVRHFAIKTV